MINISFTFFANLKFIIFSHKRIMKSQLTSKRLLASHYVCGTTLLVASGGLIYGAQNNHSLLLNALIGILLTALVAMTCANRVIFEICQREQISAHEAREDARTDALTNLGNRRHFHEHMEALLQCDSCPDYALFLLDLDDFKAVNDAFGHTVGDKLLVKVADRLTSLFPEAHISRLGGDEFALAVKAKGDIAMQSVRGSLNEIFDTPFYFDNGECLIRGSIGATRMALGNDVIDTLKRADTAMYKTKTSRAPQTRGGARPSRYRAPPRRSANHANTPR